MKFLNLLKASLELMKLEVFLWQPLVNNWQVGCEDLIITDENGQIISESLPKTQLAYFGMDGSNFAMLAYYVGGAGRSTHVVGMKFSGEQIDDFYSFNTAHELDDTIGKFKLSFLE
jgi:hypothetical protein